MILYLKQVDYELDKKLNDYDILIDNEMIWPLVLKFKYKTVLTDTQFYSKLLNVGVPAVFGRKVLTPRFST